MSFETKCPLCEKCIDIKNGAFTYYPPCQHTIHTECMRSIVTAQNCPKCKGTSILSLVAGASALAAAVDTKTSLTTILPADFSLPQSNGTFPHISQAGILFITRRPIPTDKKAKPDAKTDPRLWVLISRPTVANIIKAGVRYEDLISAGMTAQEWLSAKYSLENARQLQVGKV